MIPILATASAQSKRRMLDSLPHLHPLRVFAEEHDRILGFLEALDDLIEELRDDAGTPRAKSVAAAIAKVAHDLIAAEPHHDREEELLFPALELRGISLPPRIMRMEHQDLRALKQKLAHAAAADPAESEEIAEIAGTLAASLRDHIAKENEVLYPMALEVLSDPKIWDAMAAPFRQIGPCEWGKDLFEMQ